VERVTDEPIVFFGSGPVAAASLELLATSFKIEAVVTKPRPEHHHGSVPVLDMARKLGLHTVEVTDKKTTSEIIAKAGFKSRIGVLIDFGIIVAQDVIDSFEFGIVNSHFSLLPEWRGADPITFSILSGQSKTGVSLMLLVTAMDEGPLLAIGEYDLPTNITTPQLTDDLVQLSYALLHETLPKYITGDVHPTPQEKVAAIVGYSDQPSYSRKLSKEDSILDWNKPAEQLEREIRAFLEWPKSRCVLGGHAVIITEASADAGEGKPGTLWLQGKHVGVYCKKGILMIHKIKPAGKPEMAIESFLNGYGRDLI
jgi:methionyl-tRNA formyltransferase